MLFVKLDIKNNVVFFNTDTVLCVVNDTRELIENIVHVRCFQRKLRKYITTVEGLSSNLNLTKISQYMRKTFHCQAAVFKIDKNGVNSKIIKLQGDQRENVKKFLIAENIVPEKSIKVHGF